MADQRCRECGSEMVSAIALQASGLGLGAVVQVCSAAVDAPALKPEFTFACGAPTAPGRALIGACVTYQAMLATKEGLRAARAGGRVDEVEAAFAKSRAAHRDWLSAVDQFDRACATARLLASVGSAAA